MDRYLSRVAEVVKVLAIFAAFGAFALSMRQKEFDRFSLVKPLFEIEELDNKNDDSNLKLKLLNHGGIVYFIGCKDNKINEEKLERTPRIISSLSKKKSIQFLFKNDINVGDNFICYYTDTDLNLYELEIVYKKISNTNGFYTNKAAVAYRSDLFVTTSQKWLDRFVSFIFPKDWYSEDMTAKEKLEEMCPQYKLDKIYNLDKIGNCLLVKYSNSDGEDSGESNP